MKFCMVEINSQSREYVKNRHREYIYDGGGSHSECGFWGLLAWREVKF